MKQCCLCVVDLLHNNNSSCIPVTICQPGVNFGQMLDNMSVNIAALSMWLFMI